MKKYLLSILSFVFYFNSNAQTADFIIRHGKVMDGMGNQWQYKDVAITQDKIVAVGNLQKWKGVREIDAKGLIISPGFIDVHGHLEGGEKRNPLASNFIYDGVTTVITGNCGGSAENLNKYFNVLDSIGVSINIASLIGHNTIRKQVMGTANRNATEEELSKMEQLTQQAMKEGAVGMSTGLIYIPGTYAPTSEIVRLAKVVAMNGGVYSSHIRYEEDKVVDAVNEAINIGREANIPVEISHFKVSGQNNWGRSKETIPIVVNARKEGIDVTIDQYPYTASSTQLSVLLPDWVLADGQDSIMARLSNPIIRKKVAEHSIDIIKKRRLKHFSYAVVASYGADSSYNGKSIEEINILRGNKNNAKAEAETIIQMIEKGGAQMVYHGMSEEDVKVIMQYPFNMFASDAGIASFGAGMPHPRAYGTNARVLGKYVKTLGVITLEEAIRRMTSLPANKFNLKNRGLIKEGYFADVIIFDEDEISDMSEYNAPHQYSKGVKYVWVNGALSLEQGKQNTTRKGRAIRN
ncbi:MAG: D-aminoacylase [Bacteroidetes bacterium]|nr:D-aminoacylase [Bacteroidota bacterium]